MLANCKVGFVGGDWAGCDGTRWDATEWERRGLDSRQQTYIPAGILDRREADFLLAVKTRSREEVLSPDLKLKMARCGLGAGPGRPKAD